MDPITEGNAGGWHCHNAELSIYCIKCNIRGLEKSKPYGHMMYTPVSPINSDEHR